MNPTDRRCFVRCPSCNRCADKGRWGSQCTNCSGKYDPQERIYPDPDDVCRCTEGILQWKTQKGQFIKVKLPGDPFKTVVQGGKKTQDERDWEAYLKSEREKRNDANWDPISYY